MRIRGDELQVGDVLPASTSQRHTLTLLYKFPDDGSGDTIEFAVLYYIRHMNVEKKAFKRAELYRVERSPVVKPPNEYVQQQLQGLLQMNGIRPAQV